MDGLAKRLLVDEADRTLTDYFSKTNQNKTIMSKIIPDTLQFSIEVGHKADATARTANTIGVCILSGHFDTLGLDTVEEPHRHNTKSMNAAGLRAVNVILDDMTASEKNGNGIIPAIDGQNSPAEVVKIYAGNSDIPLRPALQFLRTNPLFVRQISIETTDGGMWMGSLVWGDHNPFERLTAHDERLNKYKSVNQYDSGKIVIDYERGALQFNEDTFFALNGIPVPAIGADPTVISVSIEFYAE